MRLPQGAELTQEQVEKAALVVADRSGHLVADVAPGEAYDRGELKTAAADARESLEALGLLDSGPSSYVRCGSVRGWHRHQELGEEPCTDCRKSWNAYHSRLKRQGGGSR